MGTFPFANPQKFKGRSGRTSYTTATLAAYRGALQSSRDRHSVVVERGTGPHGRKSPILHFVDGIDFGILQPCSDPATSFSELGSLQTAKSAFLQAWHRLLSPRFLSRTLRSTRKVSTHAARERRGGGCQERPPAVYGCFSTLCRFRMTEAVPLYS